MAEPTSSEYELALPPTGEPRPRRPTPPTGDDDGPPARKVPPSPPKPLPRISKSVPLSAEEAEQQSAPDDGPPRRSRRERAAARSRGRQAPKDEGQEDGQTLVAPTPTLDTVETRHRVRLLLGIVAASAVVLAIAMVVRAVGGGSADEEGLYVVDASQMFPPHQRPGGAPVVVAKADDEAPARDLYTRARAAMSIELARSQLQRIVDSYPNTRTAVEARAALGRVAQGRPPFPDVPTLSPSGFPVAAPTPDPAGTDVASASPEPTPAAEPEPEPIPEPELVVRVLPPGFSPHPDAREHPSGWPSRIVCEADGMTMVLIPGGTYIVGRDSGSPNEGPAHRVELPSYYLDEHEVTVGQFASYREAMTDRGEAVLPAPEELTRLGLTDRHPVVLTSAKEALRYAGWAGRSLPTEAQWEAAARGPEGLIRPWGAGAPPWTDRRAPRQLDPVMSYPSDRSPSGVFDLAANTWEWTVDWFSGDAYASRAGRIPFNPAGPANPSTTPARQTVRGSSPEHDLSYREGMRVETRLPYLGFRCALNVEGLPLPGDPPRTGAIPIPGPVRAPAPPVSRPRAGGSLVPF
ncbi:SUMF1/EgtB/PvdO family nonheme iron enzyme [Tautonia plasticadhaerens]|uniref:Serine/threonine-protein kinase pkn1 n=1 Tax=Tautonia plasticadhaerens TaxID=2527974 RepID=A0A518H3E9_9BACT|nr:SUMF1/EgtB/PvdO family nonheme iron enzyme [Tautonia plasticadhaerens]QDV35364.1 Serine/threonine-protein kinase pkn1 [Tautonia plasticadhaerens]